MVTPLITGSWIDVVHVCPRDGVYWNRKTLAYTEDEWHTLIRHLKRDLGMELLMIQNVARDGMALYPSTALEQRWRTGCEDPIGAIFAACSAEGIDVYPGIGFMAAAFEDGFGGTSQAAIDWHKKVSDEIYARYGHERSFAGWYTASEIGIYDCKVSEDQVLFVRALADYWRTITPKLPSIASPYWRGDMKKDDELVKRMAQTGVDIIAYQDGVGFTTEYAPIDPARNAQVFETLRWVHDQIGITLWANTELFRFENDIHFQPLLPGPFSRIRTQIQQAAPFVDRIVAYTVPGIMTSQELCPELGVPETERLYWAYRGYRESVLANG